MMFETIVIYYEKTMFFSNEIRLSYNLVLKYREAKKDDKVIDNIC